MKTNFSKIQIKVLWKKNCLEIKWNKVLSWKRINHILIHLRKRRCFARNVELQLMGWHYFVVSVYAVNVRYTIVIMNILQAQMMKNKWFLIVSRMVTQVHNNSLVSIRTLKRQLSAYDLQMEIWKITKDRLKQIISSKIGSLAVAKRFTLLWNSLKV